MLLRDMVCAELLAALVHGTDVVHSAPVPWVLLTVRLQGSVPAARDTVDLHLNAAQVGIDAVRVCNVVIVCTRSEECR